MSNDNVTTGCGCLIILAVIVGALLFGFFQSLARETVTDTVVKTERVQHGESSRYLIFGEQEVYEDTDSIWVGKYNSSDYYRDIEAGHTYEFEVIGWRVPFLSWYRNIVAYKEVR